VRYVHRYGVIYIYFDVVKTKRYVRRVRPPRGFIERIVYKIKSTIAVENWYAKHKTSRSAGRRLGSLEAFDSSSRFFFSYCPHARRDDSQSLPVRHVPRVNTNACTSCDRQRAFGFFSRSVATTETVKDWEHERETYVAASEVNGCRPDRRKRMKRIFIQTRECTGRADRHGRRTKRDRDVRGTEP